MIGHEANNVCKGRILKSIFGQEVPIAHSGVSSFEVISILLSGLIVVTFRAGRPDSAGYGMYSFQYGCRDRRKKKYSPLYWGGFLYYTFPEGRIEDSKANGNHTTIKDRKGC